MKTKQRLRVLKRGTRVRVKGWRQTGKLIRMELLQAQVEIPLWCGVLQLRCPADQVRSAPNTRNGKLKMKDKTKHLWKVDHGTIHTEYLTRSNECHVIADSMEDALAKFHKNYKLDEKSGETKPPVFKCEYVGILIDG
jgi:hypothetical protein